MAWRMLCCTQAAGDRSWSRHPLTRPSFTDSGTTPVHRTVGVVTRILELIAYHPGITLTEITQALDVPKSSIRKFVRGLEATGWLYNDDHHIYLGAATYALTRVMGDTWIGFISQADLEALHADTGFAVFLSVQSGDDLIYIAEASGESDVGFAAARIQLRWTLVGTAGGKALLASAPAADRDAYLRRHNEDKEDCRTFLAEYDTIQRSRIATNIRRAGTRYAIATTVRNEQEDVVASVSLVGNTADMQPRLRELSDILHRHVDSWTAPPPTATNHPGAGKVIVEPAPRAAPPCP